MNTTKQAAINTYTEYIQSRVRLFMSRGRGLLNPIISAEDLMQEASTWFIITVREHGLKTALRNKLSLHHVLYDAVRLSYPLHMPHTAFCKRENYRFVSVEDAFVDADMPAAADMENAIIADIDAERLYAQLTIREKKVVDMRMEGLTLLEIAQRLGVSQRTVNKIIHTMRKRLAEYNPMMQEG